MTDRTQVSKATEWLRTAVANNPEGLLLLAAGGVLLMRRSRAAGEGVSLSNGAEARSGRTTDSFLDQAKGVTESIASSTSDYARAAREAASAGSARIMRQAQNTFGSSFERTLRDQPLLVALGGIAAGVAIAAVLPPTNLEQQALAPIGEQISEEASRVGDQLRKTASKAAGVLRTAVQKNGLDPDGINKTVSDVTEVVREGIKGGPHRQPPSSSGPAGWRQDR